MKIKINENDNIIQLNEKVIIEKNEIIKQKENYIRELNNEFSQAKESNSLLIHNTNEQISSLKNHLFSIKTDRWYTFGKQPPKQKIKTIFKFFFKKIKKPSKKKL